MLFFYIFSMFLLHGFSPMPGITLGYMVALCAFFLNLATGRLAGGSGSLRLDDGIFGVVFILGMLPLILTLSDAGLQNFYHSVWWLGVWSVAFWWVREWIIGSRVQFAFISKAAAYGSMVLSLAIIFEFLTANTAGLYLSDFFPFSINEFPKATVLEAELQRPRGFTSEAGFSAIVFECLLPLSLDWVRRGSWRRMLFPAIAAPGYFLLFSGGSLLALAMAIFAFIGVGRGVVRSVVVGSVVMALLSVLAMTNEAVSTMIFEVLGRKILDFSLEENTAETFSRAEAYSLAWRIMTEQPWGIGWGGVSQAMFDNHPIFGISLRGTGLISFPLEIGGSAGVLGLIGYLIILWRKLSRLTVIDTLGARLAFVSLLWVSIHHAGVLELWFPMIWFTMALSDVLVVRAAGSNPVRWRGSAKRRSVSTRSSTSRCG